MATFNTGTQGASHLKQYVVSACLIFGIIGCGNQRSESDLSHDPDRPTRGTQKWNWSNVTDQSYHNVITPLLGLDNSSYLEGSHELTAWVQKWVDEIDAKVRQEHPDALVSTPKPNAKVIKQSSANAFVAPVPVCYDVKVKLKPGTPDASNTLDAVYLDAKAGEFSEWPASYDCVSGSDDLAEMQSFVDTYNASSSDCKFLVNGSGVLEGNSLCVRNDDIGDKVAANKVVLLQTANYVTVYTGIFPLMSEEALISVIAHELGHYYRSHASTAMKEFDFFYTMGEQNSSKRPTPEPAKKKMGDDAVAASTLLNASDSYTTFSSQKIRGELFMAVGSVISTICKSGSCPSACESADELLQDNDFVSSMSTYPFANATTAMTSSYKDFESKAQSCLAAVKMASSSSTITSSTIGYGKFVSMITSPVWPNWLGRISASGQRYVKKMNDLATTRAGSSAPSGQTLKDVVLALSKKMDAQDVDGEKALKTAHANRLGQYTAEQEADEVAAEWVNDIGIAPRHVVDAMRRLGKGTSTSLRGFILSESDCEDLWKRNWLNNDGSYAFVPVGDYSEVHHSSCFRMFNLDREISAHTYETPSADLPLMSASEWSNLQLKAAGLAPNEPESGAGGEGSGVAPFMLQSSLGTCPYAHSFQ